MRLLIIAAHGDNDKLHEEALAAACEAVREVNKAGIYRAWVAEPSAYESSRIVAGQAP